jgi:hypothetical protein
MIPSRQPSSSRSTRGLPRRTMREAQPGGTAQTSRRSPLSIAASVGAFALIATFAIAPPATPDAAGQLALYIAAHPQTLSVSERVSLQDGTRDGYSATAGVESLAATGTNYAWAKLVMLSGGWPQSEANITVMVRWMRQENGTDDWWNRNNPMNNGYGSGGGGGLGSYDSLVTAAQKAAENLQRNSSFSTIVSAFAVSAPTNITEQAIWASPWASSHYGNGSRWHTSPVPEVTAPVSAW